MRPARQRGLGHPEPISIHASLRDATWSTGTRLGLRTISIHAPLRDRHLNFSKIQSSIPHFNPRIPTGCDKSLPRIMMITRKFQSTHTRNRWKVYRHHFNPRIPEGCDCSMGFYAYRYLQISIHASLRDATLHVGLLVMDLRISIHAPLRDATQHADCDSAFLGFQSTHPYGMR